MVNFWYLQKLLLVALLLQHAIGCAAGERAEDAPPRPPLPPVCSSEDGEQAQPEGCIKLPTHVALISDGSRRWAKARGMSVFSGYHEGSQRGLEVVDLCYELGIKFLTVFAFSTENWRRHPAEIEDAFTMTERAVIKNMDTMAEHRIRVRMIGQTARLPLSLQEAFEQAEQRYTAAMAGKADQPEAKLTITLATSYGGRDEIMRATKAIAEAVKDGKLSTDDITEDLVTSYLDTAGTPDPDLLIRTSGEQRFSNFMLWQSAYTELYFPKTLFPDFGREAMVEALQEYTRRRRTYGRSGYTNDVDTPAAVTVTAAAPDSEAAAEL